MVLNKDYNDYTNFYYPDELLETTLARQYVSYFIDKLNTLKFPDDFKVSSYPKSYMYTTNKLIPEIEKIFSPRCAEWKGGELAICYDRDESIKLDAMSFYLKDIYFLLKEKFKTYQTGIYEVSIDYVNRWLKLKIKK